MSFVHCCGRTKATNFLPFHRTCMCSALLLLQLHNLCIEGEKSHFPYIHVCTYISKYMYVCMHACNCCCFAWLLFFSENLINYIRNLYVSSAVKGEGRGEGNVRNANVNRRAMSEMRKIVGIFFQNICYATFCMYDHNEWICGLKRL